MNKETILIRKLKESEYNTYIDFAYELSQD